MTNPALPLLGAYALAPTDPETEAELYAAVAELRVGGLEMPVPPEGAPSLEPAWQRRNLQPGWDLLLTCIPTVMGRLGTTPAYGLASTDESARDQALADVARARELAARLAEEHGRQRVVGIQVHSAPGPDRGSADALARSLDTLLGWDLVGAELLLEHCDAPVAGRTPVKGFLTLAEELAVLTSVGAGPTGTTSGTTSHAPLGMSINWGRSAIEGRNADTVVEHVTATASAGLLRAVVLSGATDMETPWGPAWGDAHIPPGGDDPALRASAASLLDAEQISRTLAAAGPDCWVAVKVSVRPTDADVATRLAVARAALELVPGRR